MNFYFTNKVFKTKMSNEDHGILKRGEGDQIGYEIH